MGLIDTVKGWFGTTREQGSGPAPKTEAGAEGAREHGAQPVEKTSDFAHDAVDTGISKIDELRPKAEGAPLGEVEEE